MPPAGIAQVLSYLPKVTDANLLVGTDTHDDAGVYRLTPELALVQTLDFFPPVVDDPYIYGQIAAANALSDVYAMGGKPVTAMNLVGYPDDKLSTEWLGRILAGGAERCQAAGCVIVGGHTVRDAEIKFGLSVTGTIHPDKILTNATAKPGDVLVLTKPLGTGFITTMAKRKVCTPELLAIACQSMVQLNKSACDAMLEVGANAATDVTGFGLAGHAYEMALGSHTTLVLHLNALPVFAGLEKLPITKYRTRASKTNREYTEPDSHFDANLDPFRFEFLYDAQTSGGLLISVDPAKATTLVKRLSQAGTFTAAIIGEVESRGPKALVIRN